MQDARKALLQGVALTVVACFVLAGMDALGKALMQHGLHPAQVVWARYTFHTLLVGALFGRRHYRAFMRPAEPLLQVVRGLCLLGVTLGMYFSIRRIALADATAIMFLAPVLVTLLAGWWLREAVRPVHWLALAMGFIGVLLIVRPGFAGVDPIMLLPLGSALLLAVYFVITRFLKDRDGELTTLFHTTAVGSVLMCAVVLFFWVPPTALQWPLLMLVGLLGAGGHLLLIRAFHRVSASSLSPYLNAQILAAAIFSAWWFDDRLSPGFVFGALLIASAGILTWYVSQRSRSCRSS
jgi:drug/metabolite transporter (DMT)-like permease